MPYKFKKQGLIQGDWFLLSIQYETKTPSPPTNVTCHTEEEARSRFANHKVVIEEAGKKIKHVTIHEMKNGVSIRCVFEYPTPKQKVEQLDLFAQST